MAANLSNFFIVPPVHLGIHVLYVYPLPQREHRDRQDQATIQVVQMLLTTILPHRMSPKHKLHQL